MDGLRPALARPRNARVIFLISAHLEAGHYFNPHAQRIIEGQQNGATVICVDPRLSNTASMVDHWLPAWPGTEPVLLLALARLLLEAGTWDREFVRRWVNWETFLRETRPDLPCSFESVGPALLDLYADYTPERAAELCGLDAGQIREIGRLIGGALGASRPTRGGPPAQVTKAAGRRRAACGS